MKNIAGPPVEGENFFGRKEIVNYFCDQLNHADILLLGPRRIGKTSTARAVMAAVRKQGWQSIEINVASCMSEGDFLEKLASTINAELSSLPRKIRKAVGKGLSDINKRIESVKIGKLGVSLGKKEPEDWTRIACDELQLIVQTKEHWLLYMDELPIMLYNIINNDAEKGVLRVRRFLDWFRNDVRALPNVDKVRWLISGSVGLDTLVQEHGMADTINSLSHEGLEPFSHEVALDLLGALADSYDIILSEDDKQKVITTVQWPQPYYLQMAFHHLRALIVAKGKDDLPALIQQAVDKMAQPGEDNDFHHWEKRLTLQLKPTDADHALALLTLSARDPGGMRAETLLSKLQERMSNNTGDQAKRTFIRLRDILLRDAYWQADETETGKHYRFCLEPLRLWWVRRDTL